MTFWIAASFIVHQVDCYPVLGLGAYRNSNRLVSVEQLPSQGRSLWTSRVLSFDKLVGSQTRPDESFLIGVGLGGLSLLMVG